MCTERVRVEDSILFGSFATVPAVNISAAVSPTTRPIARITPERMQVLLTAHHAEDGTKASGTQTEAAFPIGIRYGFQRFLCGSHDQREGHNRHGECAGEEGKSPAKHRYEEDRAEQAVYNRRNTGTASPL